MGIRDLGLKILRRAREVLVGEPELRADLPPVGVWTPPRDVGRPIDLGDLRVGCGVGSLVRPGEIVVEADPPSLLEPEIKKTCNVCGRSLPIDEFFRMERYPDGRRPSCKDCMAERRGSKRRRAGEEVDDGGGEQSCSKCGILKPVTAFDRDASKASGRRPSCKDCDREQRDARGEPRPCKRCGQSVQLVPDQAVCEPCRPASEAERDRHRRELRADQKRRARIRERDARRDQAKAVIASGRKRCDTCEEEKPLEAFPKRPGALDGRASSCDSCAAIARGADPQDLHRVGLWGQREQELLSMVPKVSDDEDLGAVPEGS